MRTPFWRSRWRVVDCSRIIAELHRLGDFKFEPLGDKSEKISRSCFDRFVEIRSAKLRRREIDGHPHFFGPGHRVFTGLM